MREFNNPGTAGGLTRRRTIYSSSPGRDDDETPHSNRPHPGRGVYNSVGDGLPDSSALVRPASNPSKQTLHRPTNQHAAHLIHAHPPPLHPPPPPDLRIPPPAPGTPNKPLRPPRHPNHPLRTTKRHPHPTTNTVHGRPVHNNKNQHLPLRSSSSSPSSPYPSSPTPTSPPPPLHCLTPTRHHLLFAHPALPSVTFAIHTPWTLTYPTRLAAALRARNYTAAPRLRTCNWRVLDSVSHGLVARGTLSRTVEKDDRYGGVGALAGSVEEIGGVLRGTYPEMEVGLILAFTLWPVYVTVGFGVACGATWVCGRRKGVTTG